MGTNETMNDLAHAVESTLKPVAFDSPTRDILDLDTLLESTKANIPHFDFGEVIPLPPLSVTPWSKPR